MPHTPGPWIVENVNSEYMHDICRSDEIPGAGSPIMLATVFCDEKAERPGDISPREADANARLIAAAPDLLCEAKALVALRDSVAIDSRLVDEFDGIRAAIAKAERIG